jgi:hypothetical protein
LYSEICQIKNFQTDIFMLRAIPEIKCIGGWAFFPQDLAPITFLNRN